MIRETVDGRPIYLSRGAEGWLVKWGRTVVAVCSTWREAMREILDLFGVPA